MNIDVQSLSVEEKLQLIEQIWDSIDQNQHSPKISKAHRDLLDERIAEWKEDGDNGLDAFEVIDKIIEES